VDKSIFLSRHEYLVQPGKVDTNVYWIEEGSIRAFIVDRDDERNVRFGYAGELMTVIDSYFTQAPTVFYFQAIKKCHLHIIPQQRLETFFRQHPQYLPVWQNTLENLVVQQIEREMDLLTSSPELRYKRVLERSPRLFQEIPLKHIANYLRMTPETLSRLKKS